MNSVNKIQYSYNQEHITFLSEFIMDLLKQNSLEEICKFICDSIQEKIKYRTVSIFLFSKYGNLERKYISGISLKNQPPIEFYNRGQGLVGITIGIADNFGEAQSTNDYENENFINSDPQINKYVKDYKTAIYKEFKLKERITQVITVPLNAYNRASGVIRVVNKIDPESNLLDNGVITESDKNWLNLIGTISSIFILNFKMLKFRTLTFNVNDEITRNRNANIYNYLASLIISEITLYSNCIIRLYNEKNRQLDVVGNAGQLNYRNIPILEVGQGVVGETFLSDAYYVIEDFTTNAKNYINLEFVRENGFISMICLPILNFSRTIHYGTISIYTKFKFIFGESDIKFLSDFTSQLSNVIQIIKEKEELRLINNLAYKINKEVNITSIFNSASLELPNITGFDGCTIAILENNFFKVIASKSSILVDIKIPITIDVIDDFIKNPKIRCFQKIPISFLKSEYSTINENVASMVWIPIFYRDKLYGIIALLKSQRKEKNLRNLSFNCERDKGRWSLYETLSNLLGTSIEKFELIEREKIELKYRSIINEIHKEIISDEDLENNLKIILNKVRDIYTCDIGYISLLSKKLKYLKPSYTYGFEHVNFPKIEIGGISITGWMYYSKLSHIYPSIEKTKVNEAVDSMYVDYIGLKHPIKSELISPMLYNNEVVGYIAIGSAKEGAFSINDKLMLETICSQTALTIQNKKFYNASLVLSEIIFDDFDTNSICKVLAKKTNEIMETPVTCVWIKKLQDDREYLSMQGWDGVEIEHQEIFDMPKEGGGVSWKTMDSIHEIVIPEMLTDSKHDYKHPEFAKKYELDSMISVPIISGKEAIGVINAYAKRRYNFLDKEVALLKNLAIDAAIFLKYAESFRKNEELMSKWSESHMIANPGIIALGFVHDINNTLNNLNIELDTMENCLPKSYKDRPEINSLLDSITEHSDYIRKSFKTLVRIGKRNKSKPKFVSLYDVFDEIKQLFHRRFIDHKIDYELSFKDSNVKDIVIECYANEIEQVFVNLILNSVYALKNISYRRRKIEIIIYSYQKNNSEWVKISVKDNGLGISKTDLNKIFRSDFSTKGEEGCGFGLSICKRVIEENHNGSIITFSELDKFTLFVIDLPKKFIYDSK